MYCLSKLFIFFLLVSGMTYGSNGVVIVCFDRPDVVTKVKQEGKLSPSELKRVESIESLYLITAREKRIDFNSGNLYSDKLFLEESLLNEFEYVEKIIERLEIGFPMLASMLNTYYLKLKKDFLVTNAKVSKTIDSSFSYLNSPEQCIPLDIATQMEVEGISRRQIDPRLYFHKKNSLMSRRTLLLYEVVQYMSQVLFKNRKKNAGTMLTVALLKKELMYIDIRKVWDFYYEKSIVAYSKEYLSLKEALTKISEKKAKLANDIFIKVLKDRKPQIKLKNKICKIKNVPYVHRISVENMGGYKDVLTSSELSHAFKCEKKIQHIESLEELEQLFNLGITKSLRVKFWTRLYADKLELERNIREIHKYIKAHDGNYKYCNNLRKKIFSFVINSKNVNECLSKVTKEINRLKHERQNDEKLLRDYEEYLLYLQDTSRRELYKQVLKRFVLKSDDAIQYSLAIIANTITDILLSDRNLDRGLVLEFSKNLITKMRLYLILNEETFSKYTLSHLINYAIIRPIDFIENKKVLDNKILDYEVYNEY